MQPSKLTYILLFLLLVIIVLKVEDRSLTGTVIDSGDGVTHVIPVVSQIRSIADNARLSCDPALIRSSL